MYVPGTTIDLSYLNAPAVTAPEEPSGSGFEVDPGTRFLFIRIVPSFCTVPVAA